MNIALPLNPLKNNETELCIFEDVSLSLKKYKTLSYQSDKATFFFIRLKNRWYPLSEKQNIELEEKLDKYNNEFIPFKALGKKDSYVINIDSRLTEKEITILKQNRPWDLS